MLCSADSNKQTRCVLSMVASSCKQNISSISVDATISATTSNNVPSHSNAVNSMANNSHSAQKSQNSYNSQSNNNSTNCTDEATTLCASPARSSTTSIATTTRGTTSATQIQEDCRWANSERMRQDGSPHALAHKKIEALIERMQDGRSGVPVRTVKSFISKVPSVFTGAALISWLCKNISIDEQEAIHLAQHIALQGYVFPVEDHILTVTNDLTYYRFQTPFLWPSNSPEPENYDYAVYLCKRTMQNKQRLELVDYEAESLARLQKIFARKWEFVYLQAEAQARVDRKRDRLERKVLDSQERAFWDLHRPAPGCVNSTDEDVRKSFRKARCPPCLRTEVLQRMLERRRIRISKVADSYVQYFDQYSEFDSFITPPSPTNPWITDTTEFWLLENSTKEVNNRRIKRWSFGLQELLKDVAGRQHFRQFLEKEFSAENLKFWEVCEKVKRLPLKDVRVCVTEIYREYLSSNATEPVNLDCTVLESIKDRIERSPDRYCLEEAQEHIFQLMKRDSYNRYIRLGMPGEFMHNQRKKSKKRFGSVRKLRDLSSKISIATRYSEV